MSKIRAKIKIGDLIESLGCTHPMQEIGAPKSLKIKTPIGYKKVEGLRKTDLNPEWKIKTNNFSTIVADEHKVETKNGTISDKNRNWEFVKNIKIGDEILTKNGYEKVTECNSLNKESCMYDLQVKETNSYFGDGIHSHNSVFLPNFGIKALMNGLNVAHYTMEMSEERLGLRYDSIATGITTSTLMDHPDEIKKKYETFKHITEAKLKLKEFPTGSASVLDIEAHLEQLKIYEGFVPDLLIIDYGDIMKSTRKTANTYEEQGWIFRELRGLAVKKNISVITATQANRDSMDNDGGTKEIIGMNQTADSMEKNRILDGLFTITQKRQEKDQGKINLWVAKNRNGASNILLQFLINYNTFKITEALLGSGSSSQENEDLDIEA